MARLILAHNFFSALHLKNVKKLEKIPAKILYEDNFFIWRKTSDPPFNAYFFVFFCETEEKIQVTGWNLN